MRSSRSKTQELCNVRTNSKENSYPRLCYQIFCPIKKHFLRNKTVVVLILQISCTLKTEIIRKILTENGYKKENVIFIGDAIADLEGALNNDLNFIKILAVYIFLSGLLFPYNGIHWQAKRHISNINIVLYVGNGVS